MRFRRMSSRGWKKKFEGSPGNDKPGTLLCLLSFESDSWNRSRRLCSPSLLFPFLPIECRESFAKIQTALSDFILFCFLLLVSCIYRNRVSTIPDCAKIRVPSDDGRHDCRNILRLYTERNICRSLRKNEHPRSRPKRSNCWKRFFLG